MDLSTILTERLAIVGGTGSGKSYTARGLVEKLLVTAHGRVGIIDPTGVWHGLRVMADGKSAGFPVVVFGGDRSDVPLVETAGRVIAQAVAATHQSWIIDTSALKTKAAERRFMLDFLDALFESNRADITLVVDEADRFSPQRMSPETARLHERMEEIVRRGRVRGFTPWLITQRPASLNKDVLSQATAMVCMRMTGKHDRDAMGAVIEGQADKMVAKAIVDAMPRHKVGNGLVWAPQQDILLPVQFPKIVTLDTMRAPKPGERRRDEALPPIDLGALRDKLATVEAETKANDPKALKAEIARLKAELAKKPVAETVVDQKEMTATYERGYAAGQSGAFDLWLKRAELVRAEIDVANERLSRAKQELTIPEAQARPAPPTPGIVHRPAPFVPQPPRPAPSPSAGSSLPKAERLILTVLAQRHPERVPVDRIAAIAGYSAGGGGFNNALSSLRGKAFIEQGPSPLAITADGLMVLGHFDPLPTGPELLAYWIGRVAKAERAILEAASRGLTHKDAIAAAAGYAPDGGGFNNALSRLRTLGLITGRGTIELHEDLR